MRILVLSDTHGDFNRMMKAVTEQPTAEVIIHCGDGHHQRYSLHGRWYRASPM